MVDLGFLNGWTHYQQYGKNEGRVINWSAPLFTNTENKEIQLLDVSNWTLCAAEGGVCIWNGTKDVAFGANGMYIVMMSLPSGTWSPLPCTLGTVGVDPVPGVRKACYFK